MNVSYETPLFMSSFASSISYSILSFNYLFSPMEIEPPCIDEKMYETFPPYAPKIDYPLALHQDIRIDSLLLATR